jgi:hypothetical protein
MTLWTGFIQRPPGHALHGDARLIAEERNDSDVSVDDHVPFIAFAETDSLAAETVRKAPSLGLRDGVALPMCFLSAFAALYGAVQAGDTVYILRCGNMPRILIVAQELRE